VLTFALSRQEEIALQEIGAQSKSFYPGKKGLIENGAKGRRGG